MRKKETKSEPYLTEPQRKVLAFLSKQDKADISDLASAIQDTHHTVRSVMRCLKQKGLVASYREERRIKMFSRSRACFVNIFYLKHDEK